MGFCLRSDGAMDIADNEFAKTARRAHHVFFASGKRCQNEVLHRNWRGEGGGLILSRSFLVKLYLLEWIYFARVVMEERDVVTMGT